MKLFRSMEGFIFSFGFNMQERKPDTHYIGWCDPETLEWEGSTSNQAGWIRTPFRIDPFDVREDKGGTVIAHQTDYIIVLLYISRPLIWQYTPYTLEQAHREGIIEYTKWDDVVPI